MPNANKTPTQSGSQQDSPTVLSVSSLVLRLRQQETPYLRPRQQWRSPETRRAFLLSKLTEALELTEEVMGEDYD
jgi:hypothetical protein